MKLFYHPNRKDRWTFTTYSKIESARIHCCIVRVEGLNTLTCSDIPHWNCLVTTRTCKDLWEWKELDWIDGVNVTSKCKSAFCHIQVPHLDSVVHGAREQEVSSVMECNFPDWLSMFSKCLGTASVYKVPHFYCTISWSGCKQISSRMELNSTNPVNMTFTTHNEFTIWYTPEFPSCIIASSSHNVFLWVVTHRCNAHQMALHWLDTGQMRADNLVSLTQVGVVSFFLRDYWWMASLFQCWLTSIFCCHAINNSCWFAFNCWQSLLLNWHPVNSVIFLWKLA